MNKLYTKIATVAYPTCKHESITTTLKLKSYQEFILYLSQ